MSGKRQKNQLELAFMAEAEGEAQGVVAKGPKRCGGARTKARPRTNN
jgi:hypothetical protein